MPPHSRGSGSRGSGSRKLTLEHAETVSQCLDVRCLMCGRDLDAQTRVTLGNHWEPEADDEDAEFKQALRHRDRLRCVVHDDRTDRGRALENLETRLTDAGAGCVDIRAELRHALRLAHEDLDRFLRAAGDGAWERIREEGRTPPLDQKVDRLP